MKGFKKTTETGEVLFAPNFVSSKNFELRAEKHTEYTYPVDGWEWVEDYEPEPDMQALEAEQQAIINEINLLTNG